MPLRYLYIVYQFSFCSVKVSVRKIKWHWCANAQKFKSFRVFTSHYLAKRKVHLNIVVLTVKYSNIDLYELPPVVRDKSVKVKEDLKFTIKKIIVYVLFKKFKFHNDRRIAFPLTEQPSMIADRKVKEINYMGSHFRYQAKLSSWSWIIEPFSSLGRILNQFQRTSL